MAKDPVFQSMFGNRNKEGKGKKKETDEKTSSGFLLPKRCPPKQNKDEQWLFLSKNSRKKTANKAATL